LPCRARLTAAVAPPVVSPSSLPPGLALTAPSAAVALALARRNSLPARGSKKEEKRRETLTRGPAPSEEPTTGGPELSVRRRKEGEEIKKQRGKKTGCRHLAGPLNRGPSRSESACTFAGRDTHIKPSRPAKPSRPVKLPARLTFLAFFFFLRNLTCGPRPSVEQRR
jgi:hypothetical protein